MEQQFGESPLLLQELRFVEQGRDLLVISPGAARPFSPLKQQWVFPFDAATFPAKLHSMTGPTPEELFQTALDCETRPETLPRAVENYRQVLERAPDWVDAHINLGVALYQLGNAEEARAEFFAAVQLDPLNGISRYNLGCVLEEQGEFDEAIDHLQRAARAMPAHADVHFNLALVMTPGYSSGASYPMLRGCRWSGQREPNRGSEVRRRLGSPPSKGPISRSPHPKVLR